jgi:hypothetical protein
MPHIIIDDLSMRRRRIHACHMRRRRTCRELCRPDAFEILL